MRQPSVEMKMFLVERPGSVDLLTEATNLLALRTKPRARTLLGSNRALFTPGMVQITYHTAEIGLLLDSEADRHSHV